MSDFRVKCYWMSVLAFCTSVVKCNDAGVKNAVSVSFTVTYFYMLDSG